MRRLVLLVLPLALLTHAACARERKSAPVAQEARSTAAAAWVDGEPIALHEVAALAEAAHIAPEEALARLVRERLLLQHAAQRGYGEDPALERALERARVRALLAQAIERGTPDDAIEERKRRLDALLAELARRTPVRYDEQAIARFAATAP